MRQSLLKKLNEKITDITKLEIKITTMGKSHERRQCLHCSMMGYDWLFTVYLHTLKMAYIIHIHL